MNTNSIDNASGATTSKAVNNLRRAIKLALAGSVLASGMASAVLLDHGPGDPTLTFPSWYRDLGGNAVGLCKSQDPSPNALAAPGLMCFPFAPDPAGFAGNIGPEIFYNMVNIKSVKNASGFNFRYIAGLEASYLPLGVPVHGTETVFARVRIGINFNDTALNGHYRVTHPFGQNEFDIVASTSGAVFGAGAALFFTFDVPLGIPNNFEAALGGPIGPWIQWDVLNAGENLTVNGNQFLGDPNYDHTFTGSQFATPATLAAEYAALGNPLPALQNYILIERIDPITKTVLPQAGVTGGLDGLGNNWVYSNVGAVLGQKWLAPIAQPLSVSQATFGKRLNGLNSFDVWAQSNPGQKLYLTDSNGSPSLQLFETAGEPGIYHGHVEGIGLTVPAIVTVTNSTSVPAVSVNSSLTDSVDISLATYDNVTRQLLVLADSTDELAAPALIVEGVPGVVSANMAKQSDPLFATKCPLPAVTPAIVLGPEDQCYSVILPVGTEPPASIKVRSAGLGVHSEDVEQYGHGGLGVTENVSPAATAFNDGTVLAPVSVPSNQASVLNVLANDTLVPGAGNPTIMVIKQPTTGTLTASGTAAAPTLTYTPGVSGGPDSFTYVIQQGTPVKDPLTGIPTGGAVSNVATVDLGIAFAGTAPAGGADQFGAQTGVSNTLTVLANDTVVAGNTISAASVAIGTTKPAKGTAVANPNGTITYTANATGTDTFSYTVANTTGQRSGQITVTMTNFGGPETIAYQKVQYIAGKWTLVGSTNWFGPNLTQTKMSCALTASAGVAVTPPIAIGAPLQVDATGKFQLPVSPATPVPVSAATLKCTSTNNVNGGTSTPIAFR